MNLNDLIKRISSEHRPNFSVNLSDADGDGVIEQLDKIFIYAIASGTFENGFRLPRLSDCDTLNVSRGSLFLFYNELPKRIGHYLGKLEPGVKDKDLIASVTADPNNPAKQLDDYVVDLKYSEDTFSLIENIFVKGLDLKTARTGKGDGEPSGIYSEISSIIAQCGAIRYPKQKIIDYFNSEMNRTFFDTENRALLARITCAFQWNNESIRSLAEVVRQRGRGETRIEGDGIRESVLITDVYVPYSDILDKGEWDVEQFTPENGLSYGNLNFANGTNFYKKYDAIYCPDHSFSENLLSANAIYNFLLTAKNKLNDDGRLIINLFDPDAAFVEHSKQINQKKRFDLLLDKSGKAVDRLTGEVVSEPCEENRKIFADAEKLLPDKARRNWSGDKIAFTKMSSFIHCDMDCAALKQNLGIDPSQELNADGTPIKVWSFAEELKYTITTPDNVELPAATKDCKFSAYVDYYADRASKSTVKRDMLEYVLIDPTSFVRILTDCGFNVDVLGSDLNPYDVKNPNPDKNIFYVCTVRNKD
ncbi:MAG: hypothetical protein IJ735_04095 [Clostridia bacterium]|nr:hypothetical protein [Clostridia bacterium]